MDVEKHVGIEDKKTALVNVNYKSNFKCQLTKCQKLIDDQDEIVIRGLGKATSRAVNLALELNLNNYNTFSLDTTTYSVELPNKSTKLPKKKAGHALGAEKDELDPDDDDNNAQSTNILVPAISIKVCKHPLEAKKTRTHMIREER